MSEIVRERTLMATENGAVLLQRYLESGDADAFAQIARRYAALVYGTCLRVTGNREEAADAAQDTFFDLLKNARRVTGSLGGWLHRVATRRALDLIRRDTARRKREQAYAALEPEQPQEWTEVSPHVDQAITELDDDRREAVIQYYLRGETTVQIASAQGVNQSTVSRRIEQGLAIVRDKLRAKGVLVGATALAAVLSQEAPAAPVELLAELGKMALTASKTGAGTAVTAGLLAGIKSNLIIFTVVVLVGAGGYLAYRWSGSTRTVGPTASPNQPASVSRTPQPAKLPDTPTPSTVVAQKRSFAVAVSAGGQNSGGAGGWTPMPVGGMGSRGVRVGASRDQGVSSFSSPQRAVRTFLSRLGEADLQRVRQCLVAGGQEDDRLVRILQQPQSVEERAAKQRLESLGLPVEVLETGSLEEGVQVKCRATVLKPFTWIEEGKTNASETGDRFEMTVRLKQIGTEWKVVGL